MATELNKELKRRVSVNGADYTLVVDPLGMRLTAKGARRPEVSLQWRDLLSGDAALAVALNASLSSKRAAGDGRGVDSQRPAKKRGRDQTGI